MKQAAICLAALVLVLGAGCSFREPAQDDSTPEVKPNTVDGTHLSTLTLNVAAVDGGRFEVKVAIFEPIELTDPSTKIDFGLSDDSVSAYVVPGDACEISPGPFTVVPVLTRWTNTGTEAGKLPGSFDLYREIDADILIATYFDGPTCLVAADDQRMMLDATYADVEPGAQVYHGSLVIIPVEAGDADAIIDAVTASGGFGSGDWESLTFSSPESTYMLGANNCAYPSIPLRGTSYNGDSFVPLAASGCGTSYTIDNG